MPSVTPHKLQNCWQYNKATDCTLHTLSVTSSNLQSTAGLLVQPCVVVREDKVAVDDAVDILLWVDIDPVEDDENVVDGVDKLVDKVDDDEVFVTVDFGDVCKSVEDNVETAVDEVSAMEDLAVVVVDDLLVAALVTEGVDPHTPQYLLQ